MPLLNNCYSHTRLHIHKCKALPSLASGSAYKDTQSAKLKWCNHAVNMCIVFHAETFFFKQIILLLTLCGMNIQTMVDLISQLTICLECPGQFQILSRSPGMNTIKLSVLLVPDTKYFDPKEYTPSFWG